MPTLKLKHVPNPKRDYQIVDVSEWFGSDEETGEPFTVNVYPMTVERRGIMTRYQYKPVLDENGSVVSAKINSNIDASAIITAICSYDDRHNLVFGVDYDDAIARVYDMDEKYRGAVLRIATVAIGNAAGEKPVEEAEKN